jgi:alcohol dehydrogenase, propanol-preferring
VEQRPELRRLAAYDRLTRRQHDAGTDLPDAEAVFDLVGSDASLRQAVERVRPAGAVMVVGEAGGRVPFGFSLVPYEVHLTSSVWGHTRTCARSWGMAQRGELTWDIEPVPLTQANQALAQLRSGGAVGRIVLTP